MTSFFFYEIHVNREREEGRGEAFFLQSHPFVIINASLRRTTLRLHPSPSNPCVHINSTSTSYLADTSMQTSLPVNTVDTY